MATDVLYGGKGPVKLVSTEWLQQHLNDPNLLIIDAQPNIHDYIQEHIPGAVQFDECLLRIPLRGLPGQYIPPEAMQMLLRRIGVRADVPVLVYTGKGIYKGWGDGLLQTMVAYSLIRFGHKNVYVLDGGLDKWKAEKRPLSQVFPKIEESDFKVEVQRDMFVDYKEFRMLREKKETFVIDARPADVYQGQGPWIRPGHIPGAINVPWRTLMDDNNPALLKPKNEILGILEKNEVQPHRFIICSCGTGREATNQFLLLKYYLGYPHVKIYEGSFTEWTSYPDNPTVTGPYPDGIQEKCWG
jgi:thiosulfate/3-mercaptopyruvate sulfurtransferase